MFLIVIYNRSVGAEAICILIMLHLIAYCTAMTRATVGTRAGGPLMCAANDDASLTPGVRLSGVIDAASLDDVEELNLWCGDYKLERRNIPGQPRNPRKLLRSVMGRPAYRHAELPSRWLVWNGARWIGQMTEDLPWGFGIKQEIGQSEFDRDQNPNMYTPSRCLPTWRRLEVSGLGVLFFIRLTSW